MKIFTIANYSPLLTTFKNRCSYVHTNIVIYCDDVIIPCMPYQDFMILLGGECVTLGSMWACKVYGFLLIKCFNASVIYYAHNTHGYKNYLCVMDAKVISSLVRELTMQRFTSVSYCLFFVSSFIIQCFNWDVTIKLFTYDKRFEISTLASFTLSLFL